MESVGDSSRRAFATPLYVGAPMVEPETRLRFHALMDEAFDRNYLTNDGPLVQRLEAELAELHQVKHCALICNATIAQIVLLKALDLRGEVILPAFTFIATAHACLWQNLTPVFCDISPQSLTIDVDQATRLITPRTSAIIGVHVYGNMCDVEGLETACRQYGLKLIFDAAHAFSCTVGDTPAGNFGDAEFMSFHATKFFGTFEGGAIFTNNSDLDRRVRYVRNFGFRGYDDVGFLGINGKMSEASAAMGLASLPAIPERIRRCEETYMLYRDRFSEIPGIRVVPIGERGRGNFQYLVTLVDTEEFGVARDELYDALTAQNIWVRRYFYPGCHRVDFYQPACPDAKWNLPVTDDVCSRVLCFPVNLPHPEADVDTIAGVVKNIHNRAGETVQSITRS